MNLNLKDIRLLPNIISTFRLLLALPMSLIFFNYNKLSHSNYLIVSLIFIAFLSDLLDGFIARRKNQISELGKVIDPLADKILTGIIVLFMWYNDQFSTSLLVVILARDVIIFISGIYLSYKIGSVIASDYVGKATIFSIGIYILFKLVAETTTGNIDNLLYFIVISLSIISLINYLIRGIKLLGKNGNI